MIAVIQRVLAGSVKVEGRQISQIEHGLVALVSVVRDDTEVDARWIARKIAQLRIFRDHSGQKHFDLDVQQVGGSVLLVSQFTLAGQTSTGRRPGFDRAAAPQQAQPLLELTVRAIREAGIQVQTGQFQADMQVALINDGPATFILDSRQ